MTNAAPYSTNDMSLSVDITTHTSARPFSPTFGIATTHLEPNFKFLYPVLLLVLVWRTVVIRVRSDALIVFKTTETREPAHDVTSSAAGRFTSRLREGWHKHTSLLAWGDRGHWVTSDAIDEDKTRKANWFRIGFEPLFVDYTQSGAWYTVLSLIEVGCYGASVSMGL